jgi:hypothetical protein
MDNGNLMPFANEVSLGKTLYQLRGKGNFFLGEAENEVIASHQVKGPIQTQDLDILSGLHFKPRHLHTA